MTTRRQTTRALRRRTTVIAIAAATLISGQAAIAATNGPGHAPTYEEVQKTARDFGLVDPVADET